MMTQWIRQGVRRVLFHTPLARFLAHRYEYSFKPHQLCFLLSCIDKTAKLPGPIFEVGCFRGITTIWINTHMDVAGIEKPYIAIDTFEGFVDADVHHETTVRGKGNYTRVYKTKAFTVNSKKWVEKSLELNGVKRVALIKADANQFDYTPYHDISFALIDVDLYLPVKNTLGMIYDRMADGGIIIVDDCRENDMYDGALQAYLEFIEAKGLEKNIVHTKLGVIKIDREAKAAG
jgi:O-methyltransferase